MTAAKRKYKGHEPLQLSAEQRVIVDYWRRKLVEANTSGDMALACQATVQLTKLVRADGKRLYGEGGYSRHIRSLTPDKVRAIKQDLKTMPVTVVAKLHSVAPRLIGSIYNNSTYKDVH